MIDSQNILFALQHALAFGVPLIGALIVGIGLPMAIVGVSVLTGKLTPSTRLALILSFLVLGSTLSVALSGRSLYSDAEYYANPFLKLEESSSGLGVRSTQITTVIALIISLGEIFRWATRKIKMEGRVAMLWIVAIGYNIISVGISGAFGTFRDPQIKDLYFSILLTAAALLATGCDAPMWRKLRWALLLPSIGSLLAMIFMPRLALLPDYVSILPGFHQRLYGLTDHANSLGIVAAAALMIELCPLVRSRPSLFFLFVHSTVLVFAQSKTAWGAAVICLLFVRWSWIKQSIFSGDRWRATIILFILFIAMSCLVVIAIGIGVSSDRFLRGLDQAGIYTLTGRTEIWRLTFAEFFKNPLTGYGPSLWDPQFRIDRGWPGAGQAHNQFVQILGQAGVLGMLSMLLYIFTLGYYSIRCWGVNQGLAFVFLLMVLVRCVSESPLRMGGIIGWENLLHLIAYLAAASGATVLAKSTGFSVRDSNPR